MHRLRRRKPWTCPTAACNSASRASPRSQHPLLRRIRRKPQPPPRKLHRIAGRGSFPRPRLRQLISGNQVERHRTPAAPAGHRRAAPPERSFLRSSQDPPANPERVFRFLPDRRPTAAAPRLKIPHNAHDSRTTSLAKTYQPESTKSPARKMQTVGLPGNINFKIQATHGRPPTPDFKLLRDAHRANHSNKSQSSKMVLTDGSTHSIVPE